MSLDINLFNKSTETEGYSETVFAANYTHNIIPIADRAGLYGPVWRPAENGITKAIDLIEPLSAGIAAIRSDPEPYMALEPDNKWGSVTTFLPWLEKLLDACETYPNALIHVNR